jgi:hypothetical protein
MEYMIILYQLSPDDAEGEILSLAHSARNSCCQKCCNFLCGIIWCGVGGSEPPSSDTTESSSPLNSKSSCSACFRLSSWSSLRCSARSQRIIPFLCNNAKDLDWHKSLFLVNVETVHSHSMMLRTLRCESGASHNTRAEVLGRKGGCVLQKNNLFCSQNW